MSLENTRYIELTFINDLHEVKKQIRNTILFLYLAEKYGVSVLSDYLEGTQYGFTASAKAEGSIKLLRITDITEGKVNWDSVPYCDCDKPTKYLLKQDDILVARTGGTTGKSFIVKDVPSNVVYASYLIRLRLKNENNPEFVSSFFNSYTYWSQLVELKRGAAQPNVNAEKLKKIIIPKCSSDVQDKYVSYLNGDFNEDILDTRINEILSLFDGNQALKAEHSYQLDLLKKFRQQILQDAVQGKLVSQDSNDEFANKLLDRIKVEKEKLYREKKIKKEKPLPEIKPEEIPFEIPEKWIWCRMGEICTKITDGTHHSPTNIEVGDYKYVTAKNIKDSGIELNNITYISKDIHNQIYARCNPEFGDILYIKDGATTGVVTINNLVEPFSMLSSVALLKLPTIVSNKFLMFAMRSPYFYDGTRNDMFGVAITRVTLEKIQNSLLAIPPSSEQLRIVNKVEKLMKLCDELEQRIKQNQKYTQDLLQVALKEALKQEPTEICKV